MDTIFFIISSIAKLVKMKATVYVWSRKEASFPIFRSSGKRCLFPEEHSVQGPLAARGLIVGPVWNPNWLIQDRARITPLPPWILSAPTMGFL